MAEKQCSKCGEEKPRSEFYDRQDSKDGKRGQCKACWDLKINAWKKNNLEKVREYKRNWKSRNPEATRIDARRWKKLNPECIKRNSKEWYAANKDLSLSKAAEWRRHNQERVKERTRQWRDENAGRYKESVTAWKIRNKASLVIRDTLKGFLRRAKQGKISSTHKMLGYTPEKLKKRMECQFEAGMSWDNHGEWHVDHKIPVSHFIKKGESRPHIVNALSNLQPLWASDNRRKYCKLNHSQ